MFTREHEHKEKGRGRGADYFSSKQNLFWFDVWYVISRRIVLTQFIYLPLSQYYLVTERSCGYDDNIVVVDICFDPKPLRLRKS